MTLRPSSVPLCVPLPSPPESSLPEVPNPESDRAHAASPTVSRLLATTVTEPSLESASASALVGELLDFAAARRLDYATALIAEFASASPPPVGGECALGTDVLEDRQEDFESLAAAVPRFASMLLALEGDPDAPDIATPRSYAEAITGPYSSQWQGAMDAEMASWKSTGTYVDEVPPPGANIVDGMWIFRGVDYFQTFSPTPKMTTLQVLLHVAAQCDYELHSLDFSTAFLQGSLHEETWLRRPLGFTESFPAGTQWSLQRPVYGLHQAPHEWHDTLRSTLAALGFAPATADPSLFLRTDTSLPPFYVLVYVDDLVFATADSEALTLVKSELQKRHTCIDLGELRSYLGLQITRDRARRTITLTQSHMVHQVLQHFGFLFSSPQPTPLSTSHSFSAPPSDESVEPSGPYPELVGCLMHRKVHWDATKRVLRYLCSTSGMGLVLGGRGPVVLTGHADASWVDDSAMQRSSQGYTFSLGSGSVSWCSPVPLPPLALVSDPPSVAPLPPQGSASSSVSQVDLSPLVEPVKVSSDTSPVAVDSGAACGGANGGAGSGGAGSGGAVCPLGTGGIGGAGAGVPSTRGTGTAGAGCAGAAGAGGFATGGNGVAGAGGTGARRQETLSPERLHEWAVQWGSPGGGASRARTAKAAGATGGTGGAAPVGAVAGSPGGGAGRAGAASSGGAGPGGASAGVPGVGRTRGTGATGGSGGAGPGVASAGVPGVGRPGGTCTGGTATSGGTGGAGPGGASVVVPRVGGSGNADTGGTRVCGASRQESLSPQQLREWAVHWGSPSGGAGGTVSGGVVATRAGGSEGATTQL
ncbi:unnamed protein product [Closterium sp. NIES-54]